MSTNDDSASRRGRRPEQGGQQWRSQGGQDRDERWSQSSSRDPQAGPGGQNDRRSSGVPDPRQSDRPYDPRQGAYSAFSRHSYEPPRQEPPAPPQPPQPAPRRAPEPPQQAFPQTYYPEHAQRNDTPRSYADQNLPPYAPPQSPYEPEVPNVPYHESGRDDLFSRDSGPLAYDQGSYNAQNSHRDLYDAHSGHQAYDTHSGHQEPIPSPSARAEEHPYLQREAGFPVDDYERSFAARIAAQESQASRFFLPDEPAPQQRPMAAERPYAPAMPQAPADRGYAPSMPQAPADRGYAPSMPQAPASRDYAPAHNYNAGNHDPYAQQSGSYGHDAFDDGQDGWGAEAHDPHAGEMHGGLPQRVPQGHELDEDFFADEDELDHEEQFAPPKRGRKKLVAAALVGAIAVGGGGAYVYKMMRGGSSNATPIIQADGPAREAPDNPGGRQFANGEKSIYDRLTPDGPQTQTASFAATADPAPHPSAPPAAGSSLEDRIDEALRKAQRSGDAPAAATPASAPAGRDQPTVVRGETYRPDGTRVDAQPAVVPAFGNSSQLPPPFGNGPASQDTPTTVAATPAPFRTVPVSSTQSGAAPAPVQTRLAAVTPPAAPAAPPAAGGFYVQIKSTQDEKAAIREMQALNDKYSAVLGDAQFTVKTVDLGDKGVWFREVAGPVTTREAAADLCTKLKGAGVSSCVIPRQ
jgi:hypothetical protein